MSSSNKQLIKKLEFNRSTIMGIFLYVTVMLVLGDVVFSVTTYHDTVAVILMLAYFIYYIISELNQDKQAVIVKLKRIFYSAKWLYIAIALYVIYDLITIIYTKDIYYTLKKLPYLFEFIGITIAAVYFCDTKKRITALVLSVVSTGILVAIGSYIYYFSLMSPIYFKRLSTTRDYNVFACLLLFSMIFAYDYFSHRNKMNLLKRLLFYGLTLAIIMPSFYLAGSRRMVILLPYFALFVITFELSRMIFGMKSSKRIHLLNITFVALFIVIYLGSTLLLPIFTEYATEKEANYKQYVEDSKNDPTLPPPKKPTPSYNETTIGEMLETIEDKTMLNKRSLIYSVAFSELKQFSPIEFIFGKGASYDIYMYYTTEDEALLDAYSISEKNPRGKSWLSAHNFLLADILNGGIIKLALGIFVVIQLIAYVIKCIKLDRKIGVLLVITTALVLSNNFISGAYGMMNDIFFHTVLIMIFTIMFAYKNNNQLIRT